MLIGDYTATYTGRSMCGFVSCHEYIINIDKDRHGYIVSGKHDITDNDSATGCMTYASEISINRNWAIKEDVSQLGGE